MAKQNVFNFETMQFELVECDDLLYLIDEMNAECAAQPSAQADRVDICPHCGRLNKLHCGCNEVPDELQP